MTDKFKQLTDELALGLNFPDNAIVLCTAINNEETQNFDMTVHVNGKKYAVQSIVEFIVKQYLKLLPDETAMLYGDLLINIIKKDRERRGAK